MDHTRFKRGDYAKNPRPRVSSTDGINNYRRQPRHVHSAGATPAIITPGFSQTAMRAESYEEPADKDESVLSFNLELPTLRRPPDSGEVPKVGLKWTLIIIVGIIFFMIGYTTLWKITPKSFLFSSENNKVAGGVIWPLITR